MDLKLHSHFYPVSLLSLILYYAVYTNNAMVIPTAVTTMLAAVHKATLPFLPPPPDTAFATLLTTPARATAHMLWQLEFLKVAGMACCQLTKDHDRRISLFRDKIPEQSAVALLLEEVSGIVMFWGDGNSTNLVLVVVDVRFGYCDNSVRSKGWRCRSPLSARTHFASVHSPPVSGTSTRDTSLIEKTGTAAMRARCSVVISLERQITCISVS